jgi:nondiscriminating glutamyl-tRNA synthetase
MVRTRFAPSPTGYLHLGNVRVALFNWLYAKRFNGKFILRIEDTDIERSTKYFEDNIIRDLKWLGFDWDEGPYKQSERVDIYREYAYKLIDIGAAYRCYCSEKDLEDMRKSFLKKGMMPRYNGKCANLTPYQIKEYEEKGVKPTVRFRVGNRTIKFRDLIRGELSFDTSSMGDFIILRSDGIAAYNFANVIDDSIMNITYVIRGEDHLSNTPRQILISEALNFTVPEFAHLSMILDHEGNRLSKRHNGLSLRELREKGFLKEAIINYLALLGRSSKENREILDIDSIINNFDLKNVSKSPAIFDFNKLKWINGIHLRNKSIDSLINRIFPFLNDYNIDIDRLKSIIDVVRPNITTLSEIRDYMDIFVDNEISVDDKLLKSLKEEKVSDVLALLKKGIENIDNMDIKNIENIIKRIKEKTGLSGKRLFMPIRIATTLRREGPELIKILPLIGKELCLKRINRIMELI